MPFDQHRIGWKKAKNEENWERDWETGTATWRKRVKNMISKSDLCSDHILMEIRNDVMRVTQWIHSNHRNRFGIRKSKFIHEILIFYSYSMVEYVCDCEWVCVCVRCVHSSSFGRRIAIHHIDTIDRKIIPQFQCRRTRERGRMRETRRKNTHLICVCHGIAKDSESRSKSTFNHWFDCECELWVWNGLTLNQWILIISFSVSFHFEFSVHSIGGPCARVSVALEN